MSEDAIRQMISFAIKTSRRHFAALAKTHNKDEPADLVAAAVLKHIRQSGHDVVRVREPTPPHSTHSGKSS